MAGPIALASPGDLVDAHVHLSFATHGDNPAAPGSSLIQEIYLREQAAAGVTLVRDCGAVPGTEPPPSAPGRPEVVSLRTTAGTGDPVPRPSP